MGNQHRRQHCVDSGRPKIQEHTRNSSWSDSSDTDRHDDMVSTRKDLSRPHNVFPNILEKQWGIRKRSCMSYDVVRQNQTRAFPGSQKIRQDDETVIAVVHDWTHVALIGIVISRARIEHVCYCIQSLNP